MDDLISRQAAIRIAEQGQVQGYEWQFRELIKLSSVNPQPKTGHWIRLYNGIFRCNQCGKQHGRSNYCPNCGAKMEVDE